MIPTTLHGNDGNDTLIGDVGNETLYGDNGDDTLNPGAGTNTVYGGAGGDTLLVAGTNAGEIITLVHTNLTTFTVTAPFAATNTIDGTLEGVRVEAGDGTDTINLTLLAAGGLNYTILGGNPAGAVGDTLNVTAPAAVTLSAGPENDAGAVSSGTSIVSYDEIEALGITLNPASAVVLNGTNGDDDITIIGNGVGGNDFRVSVNGGPEVQFTDATGITVNSMSGDDDIDFDVNGLTIPATVNGDLPGTGGGDTLSVHGGVTTWTPSTGTLVVDGQTLTVNSTEHLAFDGEGAGTLLVNGTAGDDVITHTPGAANNAGTIAVNNLLAISYANIATTATALNIDPNGHATGDTVVARGTDASDAFSVPGSADIDVNGRVRINTLNTENYRLHGLGGDDTFSISAAAGIVIRVEGDEPGASDTLNYTSVAAAVLNLGNGTIDEPVGAPVEVVYTGIEHLNFTHPAALTVEGSAADDAFSVTPLSATDVDLQRNGLAPAVHATGAGTLTIDPLDGMNSIQLNGTSGNDTVDVTNTTLTLSTPARKAVTYTTANTQALSILGLTGTDTVNVVAGVVTPVYVDGGEPASGDTVTVAGANSARVTQGATSTSGIVDSLPGGAANVNFTNVEALTMTGTGTLTVRGTNDDDAITIGGPAAAQTVWINDGTVISFATYTSVDLQGRFGDDTLLDHAAGGCRDHDGRDGPERFGPCGDQRYGGHAGQRSDGRRRDGSGHRIRQCDTADGRVLADRRGRRVDR